MSECMFYSVFYVEDEVKIPLFRFNGKSEQECDEIFEYMIKNHIVVERRDHPCR